ncbi:hypothetical protein [Phaeobacter gallaeciensis]|uniref:hypothetical protein n=1 Tax=Phaeobacter gallaeciensis TaxID=60890 RepID=UPI000BBC5CC9|nr:hypothetical protein [Phaeobacter gallaeciensis]ATF17847.1 hypothetical protein PhaeoP129_01205 [Phaeobacter gallaeciensis]ATF21956.1 hypothetical protein PhaeoP128_01205 [Phaeobacter gallaeciensis]
MPTALPDYYFRVRDNGAFVFRVDSENRQRRLDMDQIAVVKLRNGEIRPHGDRNLSPEDLSAIRDWMEQRSRTLVARDMDDIHRTIDHLNLTAHWAQSKASDAQLDEITDQMLLAMHDLRSVLVRKKADRLLKSTKDSDAS